MNSFEIFASIASSIVSIIAAIFSFKKAREAMDSATEAERFRDEMAYRKDVIEISQVLMETQRILSSVSKVGPSCTPNFIRGVKCESIAREVEEYCRFLYTHCSHFSRLFENNAISLCEELKHDIELLAEAKTFDEKKRAGKSIYYKILNFTYIAKDLADDKTEQLVAN